MGHQKNKGTFADRFARQQETKRKLKEVQQRKIRAAEELRLKNLTPRE